MTKNKHGKTRNEIENVGDGISKNNAAWSFSGDIAKSFSKYVTRSVPFYQEGLVDLVVLLIFHYKIQIVTSWVLQLVKLISKLATIMQIKKCSFHWYRRLCRGDD